MKLEKAKAFLESSGWNVESHNAIEQAERELNKAVKSLNEDNGQNNNWCFNLKRAQAWLTIAKHQQAQAYINNQTQYHQIHLN